MAGGDGRWPIVPHHPKGECIAELLQCLLSVVQGSMTCPDGTSQLPCHVYSITSVTDGYGDGNVAVRLIQMVLLSRRSLSLSRRATHLNLSSCKPWKRYVVRLATSCM